MRESPISKEYREQQATIHAWLLLEWLQDPVRKPAALTFTEGPLRVIAGAIETLISAERDEPARKYRALLSTLPGEPGDVVCRLSYMPHVVDPLDGNVLIGRREFDRLMTIALKDLGA